MLFAEGRSVEDIAQIRGRHAGTIIAHLADCVRNGLPGIYLSIHLLVDELAVPGSADAATRACSCQSGNLS
jgi:Helix-turn-helix domain